jgi:hypothetical protein
VDDKSALLFSSGATLGVFSLAGLLIDPSLIALTAISS